MSDQSSSDGEDEPFLLSTSVLGGVMDSPMALDEKERQTREEILQLQDRHVKALKREIQALKEANTKLRGKNAALVSHIDILERSMARKALEDRQNKKKLMAASSSQPISAAGSDIDDGPADGLSQSLNAATEYIRDRLRGFDGDSLNNRVKDFEDACRRADSERVQAIAELKKEVLKQEGPSKEANLEILSRLRRQTDNAKSSTDMNLAPPELIEVVIRDLLNVENELQNMKEERRSLEQQYAELAQDREEYQGGSPEDVSAVEHLLRRVEYLEFSKAEADRNKRSMTSL